MQYNESYNGDNWFSFKFKYESASALFEFVFQGNANMYTTGLVLRERQVGLEAGVIP